MTTRVGGELARRVTVALIGIPVAVGLIYLGGYWLAGALAGLAALAAWEFARMFRACGVPAAPGVAGALAAGYVLLAAAADVETFAVWATLLTLTAATAVSLAGPAAARPGRMAVVTVFGAAYTGGTLAFAVWLRAESGGTLSLAGAAVTLLPVAITWLGDSAAYFVGTALGRHKLAPVISPNKSWEGAVAGFFVTVGSAPLYAAVTRPLVPWTMGVSGLVGLGALVAVAGQVGDLFESRFKRECEVKDSAGILPGHGGMLDRLDSLFFVFPFAYVYLAVLGV